MNKQEFIIRLQEELRGLPQTDVAERIGFYSEMIDDRVEDGLSEEDAVAGIGTVEEIAEHIVSDISLPRLVRERVKPKRRLQAWEIVLLALGSPVWFSLIIAALAVLFAVYVTIWAVIVCLWAVVAALAVSTLASGAVGILSVLRGAVIPGLAMISAAVAMAGFTILSFMLCKDANKAGIVLTKKIARGIKRLFIRKER